MKKEYSSYQPAPAQGYARHLEIAEKMAAEIAQFNAEQAYEMLTEIKRGVLGRIDIEVEEAHRAMQEGNEKIQKLSLLRESVCAIQ
jgi:hypothetical protein